jgi:hypothetical protein
MVANLLKSEHFPRWLTTAVVSIAAFFIVMYIQDTKADQREMKVRQAKAEQCIRNNEESIKLIQLHIRTELTYIRGEIVDLAVAQAKTTDAVQQNTIACSRLSSLIERLDHVVP